MKNVVALVVTHRRPKELARLLQSLDRSTFPLKGCVISDHAPGGETRHLAVRARVPCIVRDDATNPGPGVGWAKAGKLALEHFGAEVDGLWFLDDDVVIPPTALSTLVEEIEQAGAESIAPLLEDQEGKLWAFPEPVAEEARIQIRQAIRPAEARTVLGDTPLPFCWCTGACYLVSRAAVERHGWHRADFQILGEDIEYSMRLAQGDRAVFTTKVSVPHLPPPPHDAAAAEKAGRWKFCSLLQNLSYLSFHVPYSRHMRSYLPGNIRRFFQTYGWNIDSLKAVAGCVINGAVRGRPAGEKKP